MEGGMMISIFNQFEIRESNSVIYNLKKSFVFFFAILLVAVTFQVMISSTVIANQEKTMSMGFIERIDSANPYVCILDAAYVYAGAIYDYLQSPDENLQNQPNLASSWWFMDGPTAATLPEPTDFSAFNHNATPEDWPLGSVWEYNLTENVFWSDGEPFDAEDVVWTLNIQTGDNYAIFWAYQPSARWIDHAEIVNNLKVRVFFSDLLTKVPYPVAFGYSTCIPIMPEHIFSDEPPTYLAYEWDGVPAIGTGPFTGTSKLRKELIAGEAVNLVKNPYFDFVDEDGVRKGLGAAYNRSIEIEKLQLKFFGDENVLQLGVLSGDIDCTKIEPSTYLNWLNDPDRPASLNILSMLTPTGYTKITAINAYKEATGELNPLRLDPAVQRAMAISTNKTYLINQIYKGLGLPGISLICTPVWPDWHWVPGNETSWFNVTDGNGNIIESASYNKSMKDVMEFDLVLANQILNESGYDGWTGGEFGKGERIAGDLVGERMNYLFNVPPSSVVGHTLEFEIVTTFAELQDRELAQYHKAEWENIGVKAEPHYVNDAQWGELVYSYHFNIQMTYWSGDVDPNYLAFITTSYALWSWNDFGVDSDEYDYLYLKQLTTLNYTERKYWVDECIKWQYLSGHIITTVMPKTCYAYRNDTWTNWGDWEEQPGLAIDHFWGAAPIFYHLQYVGSPDDGINLTFAIIAVGVIAAIIATAVTLKIRGRKKRQEFMEGDDEEIEDTI